MYSLRDATPIPGTGPQTARLFYGSGMRLMEAMRLRVKDIDFDRRVIVVRDGKGGKDRVVMLPSSLLPDLRRQTSRARAFWEQDRALNRPSVEMPNALARKYPNGGTSRSWFWAFPADHCSRDPRSGTVRRHHAYEQTVQRHFKKVLELLGHSDVSTTMIYTHVLRIAAGTVASPLYQLAAHA